METEDEPMRRSLGRLRLGSIRVKVRLMLMLMVLELELERHCEENSTTDEQIRDSRFEGAPNTGQGASTEEDCDSKSNGHDRNGMLLLLVLVDDDNDELGTIRDSIQRMRSARRAVRRKAGRWGNAGPLGSEAGHSEMEFGYADEG